MALADILHNDAVERVGIGPIEVVHYYYRLFFFSKIIAKRLVHSVNDEVKLT